MSSNPSNTETNKMRSYSSVFSSTSFIKLIENDDFTFIDSKINRYDKSRVQSGNIVSYLDYIKFIYSELSKQYNNEYFFKNTFINSLLLKKYGVKNTILINEFRVGKSVADLVLINGESQAFEIKTKLDSPKRLNGQITDYSKVFKKCYIITDETLVDKYAHEDKSLGIIALKKKARIFQMEEIRPAESNEKFDPNVAMRCLRTHEYKNIVKTYYKELPEMNSFNMFNICHELINDIPIDSLVTLFNTEIKKRKTATTSLKGVNKELRQLVLALNLNNENYKLLDSKLSSPINL
ncbi:MAG: sce7726 family protein [Bacteroidales bacterium]|nr:sce7726 family protein [Bacteroidales bacterium]MCF8405236.1 sce7726 family protein [Bacteroidales bacterium]